MDNNDDDEANDADDEDNEDDNEGTQEETETIIPTLSTEKKAPDSYVPVHLLAFVLLGPPSDEPAALWNIVGAARKRSSNPN